MFIKEMVTQRKYLLEKDTGTNITFVGEPCFVGVTQIPYIVFLEKQKEKLEYVF